jgi:hypothetical protein
MSVFEAASFKVVDFDTKILMLGILARNPPLRLCFSEKSLSASMSSL